MVSLLFFPMTNWTREQSENENKTSVQSNAKLMVQHQRTSIKQICMTCHYECQLKDLKKQEFEINEKTQLHKPCSSLPGGKTN